MNKQLDTPDLSPLDERLSRRLAKSYGTLSRRSFLSMLTRKIMGVSGVVLAAQVLPFMPSTAEAQADPSHCGLHGVLCGPNCTNNGQSASWTQCCEFGCGVWRCCRYRDVCGTVPPNCNQGSGTAWCLDGQIYRCTVTECFPDSHVNLSACSTTCAQTCVG